MKGWTNLGKKQVLKERRKEGRNEGRIRSWVDEGMKGGETKL